VDGDWDGGGEVVGVARSGCYGDSGTVFRCGVDRWYGVIGPVLHVRSVCHIHRYRSKTANGTIRITTVAIPAATGDAILPILIRSVPNPANNQRQTQQQEEE